MFATTYPWKRWWTHRLLRLGGPKLDPLAFSSRSCERSKITVKWVNAYFNYKMDVFPLN